MFFGGEGGAAIPLVFPLVFNTYNARKGKREGKRQNVDTTIEQASHRRRREKGRERFSLAQLTKEHGGAPVPTTRRGRPSDIHGSIS